jgi:hypothetical protein
MASDVPPIPAHVIERLGRVLIRFGTFERQTCVTTEALDRYDYGRDFQARGNETRRTVTIGNCRIIEGGEIDGQSFHNQSVRIHVHEVYEKRPGHLGALTTREGAPGAPWINLFLSPSLFEQIWAAAAATDGVMRTLSLEYEIGGGPHYVWGLVLIERMPLDPEVTFDFESGAVSIPPRNHLVRKHPVVVEMQAMRKELASRLRGAFRGIGTFVAIIAGTWFAFSIISTSRKWFGF